MWRYSESVLFRKGAPRGIGLKRGLREKLFGRMCRDELQCDQLEWLFFMGITIDSMLVDEGNCKHSWARIKWTQVACAQRRRNNLATRCICIKLNVQMPLFSATKKRRKETSFEMENPAKISITLKR